jgi:hypothetical protein
MAPVPFIAKVNAAPVLRSRLHAFGALPGRGTQRRGWRAVTRICLVWLQQQSALLRRSNRHQLWRPGHQFAFAARNSSSSAVLPPPPGSLHAALPNPSIKPSPNGKPPGPVCGLLHSPQPGPGVSPLVPAYVER